LSFGSQSQRPTSEEEDVQKRRKFQEGKEAKNAMTKKPKNEAGGVVYRELRHTRALGI